MHAHAADLRAEVQKIGSPENAEAWVEQLLQSWKGASLSAQDRALCEFAERLTGQPASMREEHLAELRAVGLDDVSIHDAVQVISYFNYINRVADALHVDLEPEMPGYPDATA